MEKMSSGRNECDVLQEQEVALAAVLSMGSGKARALTAGARNWDLSRRALSCILTDSSQDNCAAGWRRKWEEESRAQWEQGDQTEANGLG